VSPEVDSRRGFLGPDSAAGAGLSQSPRSASLITALYGVRNIYQYSEYWELLRRPTPTDSFPIRDTR
jgi:hypothetical protein